MTPKPSCGSTAQVLYMFHTWNSASTQGFWKGMDQHYVLGTIYESSSIGKSTRLLDSSRKYRTTHLLSHLKRWKIRGPMISASSLLLLWMLMRTIDVRLRSSEELKLKQEIQTVLERYVDSTSSCHMPDFEHDYWCTSERIYWQTRKT